MNSITWQAIRILIASAVVLIIILLASGTRHTSRAAVDLPAGFEDVLVTSGMNSPTSFAFTPDGRILVAEKSGKLRVIKNGELLDNPFLSVNVQTNGERGLIGVAVDPQFESNGYIYVYYTRPVTGFPNRISRFTVAQTGAGDTADPASEIVILDGIKDGDSESQDHNGGALQFGIDGMLYVGIGDFRDRNEAQNPESLNGKVLRLDVANYPDIIPDDNPNWGVPDARDEVWAIGLRNPFSLAVDPLTGEIRINDVGEGSWEEINSGASGANYGWPECNDGACHTPDPDLTDPIHQYPRGSQAAITGGTFYRGHDFPAEYYGDYFFVDFLQGFIRALQSDGSVEEFATGLDSGPVHLAVGSDGAIYYATRFGGQFDGSIRKIEFVGTGENSQPVAVATADTTSSNTAPLIVEFDASDSSDPNGDVLTYSWEFADGTSAVSGQVVSHIFTQHGSYEVELTVQDGRGGVAIDTVRIEVGTPPVVMIESPATGTMYEGGQFFTAIGSAIDAEDGELTADSLSWVVLFHHSDHTHPFVPPTEGMSQVEFAIADRGETAVDVWYRIYLTATDSSGLSTTVTRDLLPHVATLELDSVPTGLLLEFDGVPVRAPHEVVGVAGVTREVNAPFSQQLTGTQYQFTGWSDGGAHEHEFSFPSVDSSLIADFSAVVPTPTAVTPTATQVPPTPTAVTPTATQVPPTPTAVTPTATQVPPTPTVVTPTVTQVPPTPTAVTPTATQVPPTPTAVTPTATQVPPTQTVVTPTATSTTVLPTITPTQSTSSGGHSPPATLPAPTVLSVPLAPEIESVVPGDGKITVTWKVTTNTAPLTLFRIFNVTTAQSQIVGPEVRSTDLQGLTNGLGYVIQLQAGNSSGYSERVEADPVVPVGLPSEPVNVNVVITGPREVTVLWSPPHSTGGSKISGYSISRSDGIVLEMSNDDTEAVIGELPVGVPLLFTITAQNSIGGGAPSSAFGPVILSSVSGAPDDPANYPLHLSDVVTQALMPMFQNGIVDLPALADAEDGSGDLLVPLPEIESAILATEDFSLDVDLPALRFESDTSGIGPINLTIGTDLVLHGIGNVIAQDGHLSIQISPERLSYSLATEEPFAGSISSVWFDVLVQSVLRAATLRSEFLPSLPSIVSDWIAMDGIGVSNGEVSTAGVVRVNKVGISNDVLGDITATLIVDAGWYEFNTGDGRRILLFKVNDEGSVYFTDVTCSKQSSSYECSGTFTGAAGGFSDFALVALSEKAVSVQPGVVTTPRPVDVSSAATTVPSPQGAITLPTSTIVVPVLTPVPGLTPTLIAPTMGASDPSVNIFTWNRVLGALAFTVAIPMAVYARRWRSQ